MNLNIPLFHFRAKISRDDKTDEEMELAKIDVSVQMGARCDQPVGRAKKKSDVDADADDGDESDVSTVSTASTHSRYVAKSTRLGTVQVGTPLPRPMTE